MIKEPTLFESGIFHLFILGQKNGFDRISFLDDHSFKKFIPFDIILHKEHDNFNFSKNYIDFPCIGFTFENYNFLNYKFESHLKKLQDDFVSNKKFGSHKTSSLFNYYRKTYLWYSFVFNKEYKIDLEEFDIDAIKIGFASSYVQNNHELMEEAQNLKLKVDYCAF